MSCHQLERTPSANVGATGTWSGFTSICCQAESPFWGTAFPTMPSQVLPEVMFFNPVLQERWPHRQAQGSTQIGGTAHGDSCCRVQEVTAPSYLPTHLCKTNMANAGTCLPDTSAPSSTLGLSHPKGEFEGAPRAVTKGELQQVASGCPESQTAMRGERNPALGDRGLKAMQPFLQDTCQSPNLSHAVHNSSTGASCLASWRDHKMMPFLPVITR